MNVKNILSALGLFLGLAIVSKEVLILNEEFLLICSFSIFFTVAYKNVGKIISASLDERAEEIANNFVSIYKSKKANVLKYKEIIDKYPELLDIVKVVSEESKKVTKQLSQDWSKIYANYTNYIIEQRLISYYREEVKIMRGYYHLAIYEMYGALVGILRKMSVPNEAGLVKEIRASIKKK